MILPISFQEYFGKPGDDPKKWGDVAAALIGAQMAVANIGIVISPLLFGFLGQALGMGLFGYYLLFFYVFLVIGVILNRRQFRKNG